MLTRPSPRPRRLQARILAFALAGLAAAWAGAGVGAAQAEAPPETQAAPKSPREKAKQSYERAEQAAGERRFAEALAAYREAAAADPSAPFAPAARTRAAHLTAHSEGNFAPFARLEGVRRDPVKAADRAEIEALQRDLGDAAAFPPGRVRSEARLFVAEAFQSHLKEPRRAVAPLEDLLTDPAADPPSRALALSELVALHRRLDDLDAAHTAVERWPDVAPALRREVLRLVRRGLLRDGSTAAIAALGAVGAVSLARAARARSLEGALRDIVRPSAVAFALYLGGAGAVIVRLHGAADVRPFLWLGLGVLAIDMIARAWRIGSTDPRPQARAARAIACVAGVLAVAFLALERADAGYLESFGL